MPDDYYHGARLTEDKGEGENRLNCTTLPTMTKAGAPGEQEDSRLINDEQQVRWVHFDKNGEGEYMKIQVATEEERASSMRVSIPDA